MGVAFSQVFPPAPSLTEKNVPSQLGRVFVVTGGYSGVGEALVAILYSAGATVYIAGRHESKAQATIQHVHSTVDTKEGQTPAGRLEFLQLDLSDLKTIKPAVEHFTSRESRLDVLVNNAGVNMTPLTTKTAQDHELIMGTNCIGHLLLTLLLLPSLKAASSQSSPSLTRVVWTSSQVTDFSPHGGINLEELESPKSDPQIRYCNSKTGNWFLASEFAKRFATASGILSITQNPGPLKTNLLRHGSWWLPYLVSPLLHEAKYGAYTELFCAVDQSLNVEDNSGGYVLPWGRVHTEPRPDLLEALKGKDQGGTGQAEAFWDWCEGHIREYL